MVDPKCDQHLNEVEEKMEIASESNQLDDDSGGMHSPTNVQDMEGAADNTLTNVFVGKSRDERSIHCSVPKLPFTAKSPSQRSRFASSLSTLDEISAISSFQEESVNSSIGYLSDEYSKKSKRSLKGKLNRLILVKELSAQATNLAHTGEEDEALQIYEKAILTAGSEIARINFKIRKCRGQHEATRESILGRLRDDLRNVGIIIGKLRTKMAILYERMGDNERAIACCHEAIDVYKNQPVMDDGTMEDEVEAPELMTLMIEKLELSSKTLVGRSSLLEKIEQLRHEIAAMPAIAQKIQLYQKVESTAAQLKKMEIDALGKVHPQVADTLQLLSTIALEQNKHDDAIEYLEKAIKINKRCLGLKHPRTGQYYLRLARIRLCQGIESLALDSFREATDILQHSRKFFRVLGSTCNDIAVIYIRRREFNLATQNLHQALKFYDRAMHQPSNHGPFEHNSSGISTDSIQVHRNLGECYMKMNSFVLASDAFLQVLQLQRGARKVHDNVKDLDLGILGVERFLVSLIDDESIADTLMRLGRALAAGEKHHDALTFLKEAMEVLSRIAVADELSNDLCVGSETVRRHRNDQLTNSLYCIAEESCVVGDYDGAVRAYSESMRLRSSFTNGRSPEEMQSSIVHCALCFVGIGNVHVNKQEFAAADKMFNDTLNYCLRNGIPLKHSLTAMIMQKMKEIKIRIAADSSKRVSDLQILIERADEEISCEAYEPALSTLTQALEMRRTELLRLKASDDDTAAEIYGIARLLRLFGSVYARMGDKENADRAYTDATRLFKLSGAHNNILI